MERFDYIVIGAGSAGCLLANRLSKNPQNRVLVIESGRADKDPWIHIPATFFKVIGKGIDIHHYASDPVAGMNNRPSIVPQGNVLGGGSSVNAMIYIRGHRNDYDGWKKAGCEGWGYDDVLPVFKTLENNEYLRNSYHGNEGELHVSNPRFRHPLCQAFVEAAEQTDLVHNEDFNGEIQNGVGFYQTTTFGGRRWSSAEAFLREAEKLGNVKVLTRSFVDRIVFDGKKASGIVLKDGQSFKADKEIVLSAGAIATPRILQLSGIGNAEELGQLGIEVVSDLPGVGENYQDHLEVPVQGETYQPISMLGEDKGLKAVGHMLRYLIQHRGLLSSNVVECGGFVDTSDCGQPDIQFHVIPSLVGFVDRPPEPGHGLSVSPCYLRPKSRGKIKLASSNPNEKPHFDANLLSEMEDVETLVRGVKLAIKIFEAPALKKLVKRRVLPRPGIENDAEKLKDYIRQTAKTVFHPCGTARMGAKDDKMAVVDTKLRVKGVEGLRVADASIMPNLVSGNTNAPTMMIAERAAIFMLG